ncbi:putative thc operon regulatory protein [Actinoplanes sp. SE50]|nr:putative thc operon regulatory protein [Actinoplanes sp. SE50/110]ATO87507.1 putative thc operon regulatory protein [Actinoplanes sp. SE50]SLM04925.1 AraC family transcriptional regulator [Actinoplanes sp. SE50/110]
MPAAQTRFHGITPVSASMARYWRSLIALVSGALSDPVSPLNSPLLAEDLARTVATGALHVFPNTTMGRQHVPGPGAVTPGAVRRAVAFVDADAHLPVQLSEIAAAAGTSARALQYEFRRHLGTTPLRYLSRVRLELARQELHRADPTRGDTVGAIAATPSAPSRPGGVSPTPAVSPRPIEPLTACPRARR